MLSWVISVARILAPSVERLEELIHQHATLSADEPQTANAELRKSKLIRVGLSATQRPIEEVARFLVGSAEVGAMVDQIAQSLIVDTRASLTWELKFLNRLCRP